MLGGDAGEFTICLAEEYTSGVRLMKPPKDACIVSPGKEEPCRPVRTASK
jgi:hypothetical protein